MHTSPYLHQTNSVSSAIVIMTNFHRAKDEVYIMQINAKVEGFVFFCFCFFIQTDWRVRNKSGQSFIFLSNAHIDIFIFTHMYLNRKQIKFHIIYIQRLILSVQNVKSALKADGLHYI